MSSGDGEDFDAHLDRVLIGGLEELDVRLAEYSEAWPKRFEGERRRIEASLG
ncbi:MAG TPA: hypothetical protein VGR26_15880 [Acidimicrobiales bacterium]|nr:hypothetical protein [Acidimicrobiales bacterium]